MDERIPCDAVSLYAGVHILNAPYHIDKEYDYSIPCELSERIKVGTVVIVPFGGGNRNVPGIVSSVKNATSCKRVKPIIGLTPNGLCIGEELYGICEFMKEHCFCSIGDAARTVLPSGFSVRTDVYYVIGDRKDDSQLNEGGRLLLSYIRDRGEATEGELKRKFDKETAGLAALCKGGYIVKKTRATCKENTKSDRYVRLLLSEEEITELREGGGFRLTPKQTSALFELEKNPLTPIDEFCELARVTESVIRELCKKGICEIVPIPKDRNPYAAICSASAEKQDFSLNACQKAALDTLLSLYRDSEPRAALLHGVTGSGKTNVTEKLLDECIKDGKSAIVLVPEIALTAQAVGIFVGRYGDRVAVLHSALSAGERLDAWKRIDAGTATVVLGTRSAIFAPVKNLGLVVIDEEQETSFKSDMTPKYHARDIARYRCAKNRALMLLCSATPSIESYYKAKKGIYTLVEMKERFSKGGLPTVEICDMRDDEGLYELPGGNTPTEVGEPSERKSERSRREERRSRGIAQKILGDRLLSELRRNLDSGEQTVLFINRRGYQAFVSCRKCGFVLQCPNCSVSMTHHKYGLRGGRMVCHYCGYVEKIPTVCPICESEHISALGTGTQMLEEQLQLYFPNARLLRMDTDTTSGKFSHDAILDSFRKGEADILLGTQMVTKGHDFPKVSLVGVINADSSIHMPDFRANERTFSLMTQVIGRAGRASIPGRALIQTYSPDHETLVLSGKQDYEKFYNSEIKFREAAMYPPFCDIALVTFSGETDSEVHLAVQAFGRALNDALSGRYCDVKAIVFGPFEAGIYKLQGRYRMRYVIKCRSNARTRAMLSELYAEFLEKTAGDVSISVDMNPQNV